MNSNKNVAEEILIAEDSPTQAQMLKFLLEKHNYRVSVANNGKEALEMINMRKPALIISDIVMPEMDGYELCQHIKETQSLKDIPVILLTALCDPKDVLKGLDCGANNFITKPYEEQYIVSRVQSILANRMFYESEKMEMGIKVFFGGQEYYINAQRQQILTLLLSTYETAVQKNMELQKAQDELRALTLDLEKKIEDRTIELRTVNERYRTMVELSNDAIYILDTRGNFTFANKKAAEMTGYSISEWIGKNFAPLIPPSDLPVIKEMFLLTCEGKSTQREINVIKKDGTILILEVNTTSILEDGNVVGIIGFGRDITARRQAEEELKRHREHLEELVKERTAQLNQKNEELEKFNKLFVGRELRMIELKKRISELENKNV